MSYSGREYGWRGQNGSREVSSLLEVLTMKTKNHENKNFTFSGVHTKDNLKEYSEVKKYNTIMHGYME